MDAIIARIFFEKGLRFIFSTRAKVPWILKPDGSKFFGDGYKFEPGKDDVILEGSKGYVVAFGDMVYRAHDAVLRVRQEGLDVGLVNKSTLNLVDEQVRSSSPSLHSSLPLSFLPSCRALIFLCSSSLGLDADVCVCRQSAKSEHHPS